LQLEKKAGGEVTTTTLPHPSFPPLGVGGIAYYPMYGRTGANNPMFGKVPANAMTINVHDIDNVLVGSFPSQVAAAKWLNIPTTTFRKYLSSGKVWNHQYIFFNR
jgi:hypothetical protein